jgi:hypothetical protein
VIGAAVSQPDGGYVQASYFLTGDHHEHLPQYGWFGPPHVRSPFCVCTGDHVLAGGPRAWEVAARFSYVNFTSTNLPLTNGLPSGSRETEFTVGINWYLNDNTRFMFNWVHAVPVVPSLGPSFANAFFINSPAGRHVQCRPKVARETQPGAVWVRNHRPPVSRCH